MYALYDSVYRVGVRIQRPLLTVDHIDYTRQVENVILASSKLRLQGHRCCDGDDIRLLSSTPRNSLSSSGVSH